MQNSKKKAEYGKNEGKNGRKNEEKKMKEEEKMKDRVGRQRKKM